MVGKHLAVPPEGWGLPYLSHGRLAGPRTGAHDPKGTGDGVPYHTL